MVTPPSIRVPWGQLVLVALLAAGTAHAEMYSWVDGNGDVHFADDLSQVPPDQRPAEQSEAEERSRIQVVPMSTPRKRRPDSSTASSTEGRSRRALPPPWASSGPGRGLPASLSASRPAATVAAEGPGNRAYWEGEFRKVQQGLRKVEQCRLAIPANCSLTRCRTSCRSEWENSSCRGGWVIPSACGQAFDIPGQTVSPRWGGSRSLENFSCEPLHDAADEAERIWQERLDLLEAKARAADVPQNWRGD